MKQIPIESSIVSLTFSELSVDEREMVLKARDVTKYSYSPYSGFQVGATLQLKNGTTVSGANQENAAYPSGLCAERTTIFAAGNTGHQKNIVKIAITAKRAGIENYIGEKPVGPCGACRQVMKETEDLAGEPLVVILDCFDDSNIIRIYGMKSLLPLSFGPADMGLI